jgi:hypothetical protein
MDTRQCERILTDRDTVVVFPPHAPFSQATDLVGHSNGSRVDG